MIKNLLDSNWWRFQWRYLRRQTPWDTEITPPEVIEFIKNTPPGSALDLGCGTGTNALALASRGWRVTGVDFIPGAIRAARRKAAGSGLDIEFYQASVTDLNMLSGHYSYILDIGCLFGLKESDRASYAHNVKRLLDQKGWYMLYAWHPRTYKGKRIGICAEEVDKLLRDSLVKHRIVEGEENGSPTAWYWYRHK